MKYKLVCFDLDGTLIEGIDNAWQLLHENLGTNNEERAKTKDDFFSNRIPYQEWFERDIKMWNKAGVTKDQMLQALKGLKLHEGALETLQKIKNNGIKIAIISGSIDLVLKKVFGIHQSLFDEVLINKITFGEGGVINGGKHTPFDQEHKATGFKMIAEKEDVDLSECVFVGDNYNDVHVAEIAGLSIAFDCKSEKLAEVSDVVIQEKDLRAILKHIIK